MSAIVYDMTQTCVYWQVDPLCDSNCGIWKAVSVFMCVIVGVWVILRLNQAFVHQDAAMTFDTLHTGKVFYAFFFVSCPCKHDSYLYYICFTPITFEIMQDEEFCINLSDFL